MEFEYNFGALGIPVFILLMVVEYLLLKLKGRNDLHSYSDTITSSSMGAGLLVSDALFKVYTLGVFIWLWENYRIADFSSASVLTWVVFFFGVDLCYYWFHRIAHERNFLWGAHEGHHQGEEFNYTTAIRQSAFQYGFSWVFYLPLAVLGCPPEVFVGQFLILKAYQFWIHTQGIDRIPLVEGILSTPSSHRVHHAKNPIYIDKNYGGTMVIWDRMFGTWQPELAIEACHYGTTHAPNTLSPLKLNLRHWRNLFSDTMKTERIKDKFALWFKPTGWRPADCVDQDYHLQKEGTADRPKYDPHTTLAKKIYAGFATFLTFTVGVIFIFLSPQLTVELKIGGALLLVMGLIVVGDLLENKSRLIPLEMVRLPLMLWFMHTLCFYPVTTTMAHTVTIHKPALESLRFAADVIRWPEWHPSSKSIEIATKGPLLKSQQFNEEISTPIGPNSLIWTGQYYAPAQEWKAKAQNLTNGSSIELTYSVTSTPDNHTQFTRTLSYTLPNIVLVAGNALRYKKQIDEKSRRSLAQLKQAIEAE